MRDLLPCLRAAQEALGDAVEMLAERSTSDTECTLVATEVIHIIREVQALENRIDPASARKGTVPFVIRGGSGRMTGT